MSIGVYLHEALRVPFCSRLLPPVSTDQLADHYSNWFSELSFSIICESTVGYTFIPCVGSFTFPGIDTR